MKVLKQDIDKNFTGSITLVAENEEDMWLVYNLVQIGDKMQCSTVRKVQNESATGSVQTKQVRTKLTIKVEKIDFDLQVIYNNCFYTHLNVFTVLYIELI